MANKTDYTNEKEADLYKEIATLREQVRSTRVELNPQTQGTVARQARRTIARIQTELTARAKHQ